jgi:hypothetical protein
MAGFHRALKGLCLDGRPNPSGIDHTGNWLSYVGRGRSSHRFDAWPAFIWRFMAKIRMPMGRQAPYIMGFTRDMTAMTSFCD